MLGRRTKTLEQTNVVPDQGRLELLRLLRPEMDDAMLRDLAGADGGMNAAEHYAVLAQILQTGEVPSPLPPIDPIENCRIAGYQEVELGAPLSTENRRRQVIRLFACWILINVYADPNRYENGQTEEGDETTLQRLTEASIALGPEFVRAAILLVVWARFAGVTAHDPFQDLFYLLSLVVLRCATGSREDLAGAAQGYEGLVEQERILRAHLEKEQGPADAPLGTAWLFGLLGRVDAREVRCLQDAWRRTVRFVIDRLACSSAEKLDPRCAEFEQRISGEPR